MASCPNCAQANDGIYPVCGKVVCSNCDPSKQKVNRVYSTGAQRDNAEGKGRFDLIPYSALFSWAQRLELGGKKYGFDNWKKGMPLKESYLCSAFRHLGQLLDADESEDHAGAILFNIGCFIETRRMIEKGLLPKELNDWS